MRRLMNMKLFLIAVAIVAVFGIAAVVGPVTVTPPAAAQNMTGDNATMMAGNMTAGNMTAATGLNSKFIYPYFFINDGFLIYSLRSHTVLTSSQGIDI